MKYVIILFLIILSIHPLSYAKYNWNNNNKLGAIGVILLAIAEVIAPSLYLLLR